MHKKLVAFFSLFVALCAACPLYAKKARSRHKKTHAAYVKPQKKNHSVTSANVVTQPSIALAVPHLTPHRNYCESIAQNIVPIQTHYAKITAPTTTVTSSKSSSVAAKRRNSRHKKKRTYIVRRRKVRRLPAKQVVPVKTEYTPDQLKKIAKWRVAASFIWPIKSSNFYISSPYGARRNPNGTAGFHTGIDMAAVKGTPVMAVADAIVLDARPYKGYGNMILLGHRHKLFTRYAHLDRILVKKGEIVRKGAVIGRVGNTGRVRHRRGHDGSHLHWETYIKGKRVNPRLFV